MVLYDEISRNNRTTIILFAAYTLLYGVVITGFLAIVGLEPNVITFAAVLLITFVIAYFMFSRAPGAILAMTGAQELRKQDDPYLFNIVEALSIGAGIPMPKVYLIQSEALNAFATGPDPQHSLVAITSGLRKKLNRLELEGVMAHEISHIKNYDIRSMLVAAMFAMIIAAVSHIGLRTLRHRGGGKKEGGAIVLIFAVVALILAPIFSTIIKLAISRNREYAADASAAMLTRYPMGLANALPKIQKEYTANHVRIEGSNDATRHLFIFDPTKKTLLNAFSTHPRVEDRIARLKKM